MRWRINADPTQIFLNTTGTMADIPHPLSLFLNYIETGQALDAYTRELDSAVAEVRTNEKWRKPIMTMEMLIRDRENAAKNEGREEGRKEGIKEGIKEGSANTAKLMSFLAQNGRYDDIIKAADDEEYLQKLFDEMADK